MEQYENKSFAKTRTYRLVLHLLIYSFLSFRRFRQYNHVGYIAFWMQLTCHFGPYRNCPNCSNIDRNDFTFLQYSHYHGYNDKHLDFLGTKIQFLQSRLNVFWVLAIYNYGFSKVENEMRNGFYTQADSVFISVEQFF